RDMTMAETIKTQNPTPEFSRVFKDSSLNSTVDFEFAEVPSDNETNEMAALFDVVSIRKMRFTGAISPFEDDGWLLEGKLGVTVSQNCVVTLDRVRTRLDLEIRRIFTPMAEPEDNDITLDASHNDELEPLGREIDLGLVAMEALALAIPEYPRVEGAELPESNFSPPDTADIEEEAPKPFAGLAALKEKLSNPDE
ncbi:MAG: YceD family protein, partial [Alphaproteobacteria bacterium]